jgi:hypothetical protein
MACIPAVRASTSDEKAEGLRGGPQQIEKAGFKVGGGARSKESFFFPPVL